MTFEAQTDLLTSQTTVKPTGDRKLRMLALANQSFDEKKYETDYRFKPSNLDNPFEIRTTHDMLKCVERKPEIEIQAKVLCARKGKLAYRKLDQKSFLESFKKGDKKLSQFKEWDSFSTSDGVPSAAGRVGQDFTPLLGGPFYKNLYYYEDYIRMHADCFYAYHHDPIAKSIISITRDFVLGTGYEVQCDLNSPQGKIALAAWKAFEKANNFQEQIDDVCVELGIYGETMLWWLPNHQSKITYQLGPQDTIPYGIIPRVRVLDPSNMVEIVTYPEDITRKLFYVWLTPTQYQIYTSSVGTDLAMPTQPTLKFIYQHIPADQILHYRVNAVSNEKRGRSDLFPVLSYLKRLRDSVNYAIIAQQKASAWSIDTTIDGNQADIDAYVQAQAALGTIPPAGSEFVHSKAIERQYLNNTSNSLSGMQDAFSLTLSMICAGVQIPINWLGTHLSGGSTRASAIVATEPVAKKMEKRREVIKRIIQECWARLMRQCGLEEIPCNVIFPELITQDRNDKLKGLLLAQQSRWISPQRAATLAAKELGIQDFNYTDELESIQKEIPEIPMPLSDPGKVSATGKPQVPEEDGPSLAITQTERSQITDHGREL